MRNALIFTLLELLIVITVLMILLSFLMPALNKSKQTARKISCIGNLKQIALAFNGYESDYNGCFPVVRQYNPSTYWYNDLLPPYINNLKIGRRDLGHPEIKSIYCSAQNTNNSVLIYYSYGYNAHVYNANGFVFIDGNKIFLPLRSNQAKRPSVTCLMTDSETSGISYYASDPDTLVAFRHSGGTNVLFIDGHVNWLKLLSVPDYLRDGISAVVSPFWDPLR